MIGTHGDPSAGWLDLPFEVIAFDWDGTAVPDRRAKVAPLCRAVSRLLSAGVAIAVVCGTRVEHVERQLTSFISGSCRHRLHLLTNRGSERYGFGSAGQGPVLQYRRGATAREDRLLTAIADAIRQELVRRTGLSIRVVYDRLNRRKIDLIPLPEWSDPPKSAIADLLSAVEARLRGAGLAGGLAEAMSIAERVARYKGLPDARITTDAKHLEVGLTGKGDAISWVVGELAKGIPTERVLIAGDEFGTLGGVPGSDARMKIPETAGAVFVSVGVEPEGVAPGVLHLGGGPRRFWDLLEDLADQAERGNPGEGGPPVSLAMGLEGEG